MRAVFGLAGTLEDQQPIADLPLAKRIVAQPLEDRLSLAVFQLDDYKPISEAQYQKLAQNPQQQVAVGFSMLGDQFADPLDYKVLVKRTGYVSQFPSHDEDEPDKPAQQADAATQK